VTLHDVFINNPNTGATVSLGANVLDDLTLSGSLEIDNGTFNAAGRRIYILAQGQGIKTVNGKFLAATTGTEIDFMGGGDNQTSANYLQLLPGDDLSKATVHVATGSPTVLQLLSDVTANGLRIDNGCAIVLNNHTLTIAGTNIPAGAYDMGNVYNTWADLAPVPEPGTMLLIGTATAGLLGWMRRRRMK
jgi:hypothetical protein